MTRMLLDNGYKPIVFDNLSTGRREFVEKKARFVKGDLKDKKAIKAVFRRYKIDLVMHFAAATLVPESVVNPLKYYENNVCGSLNLFEAMLANKVKQIVFSSTCAIYGEPDEIVVTEDSPARPLNPYAHSKYMVEQILQSMSVAHDFRSIILRYFNVAGSHPKADIGVFAKKPTLLIPSIMKVAAGKCSHIKIFGDDYDTPDGTCIRDYIHVMDLCQAHLLALQCLADSSAQGVINLGSGKGFSVKEVIDVAQKVIGHKIKVKISSRRSGDISGLYASFDKASRFLGWSPKASLEQMIRSAWEFEKKNR